MRKLDFGSSERGAEFYTIIYDGIMTTQRGFEAPHETRVLGKILTALEGAGHSVTRNDGTPMAFPSYDLNEKPEPVVLELAEYKLAREALAKAQWNARSARRVTEMFDWFDAAPPHTNGTPAA